MKRLFTAATCLLLAIDCNADIYKYTDQNGVVTYTNVKPARSGKSELIIAGPKQSQTEAPAKQNNITSKSPSPASFPKVDHQTQNQRDLKRKEILLSELDQEKQALENAKVLYEEARNNPEVYRTAQGKTFRNVAKYEEKLRIIEAEIQAHERNIELLNKELNH
ncbi:DUF4124 domain-containing protein [Methylophilus aquaticus]|uniref:DUF4124 domain-containing protein n=1 Tax=Methylophilus aquaticus TaxID=1971610 RepID=A0ABT9JWJ4_9PROT|nr:DUF4124 domain-containing protein [Methylophilus aquaticus]MDP8568928.1 DUF4124 domain-containing protein [Methylophilus aquaticus]